MGKGAFARLGDCGLGASPAAQAPGDDKDAGRPWKQLGPGPLVGPGAGRPCPAARPFQSGARRQIRSPPSPLPLQSGSASPSDRRFRAHRLDADMEGEGTFAPLGAWEGKAWLSDPASAPTAGVRAPRPGLTPFQPYALWQGPRVQPRRTVPRGLVRRVRSSVTQGAAGGARGRAAARSRHPRCRGGLYVVDFTVFTKCTFGRLSARPFDPSVFRPFARSPARPVDDLPIRPIVLACAGTLGVWGYWSSGRQPERPMGLTGDLPFGR